MTKLNGPYKVKICNEGSRPPKLLSGYWSHTSFTWYFFFIPKEICYIYNWERKHIKLSPFFSPSWYKAQNEGHWYSFLWSYTLSQSSLIYILHLLNQTLLLSSNFFPIYAHSHGGTYARALSNEFCDMSKVLSTMVSTFFYLSQSLYSLT